MTTSHFIQVSAVLRDGEVDFQFEPEAKFWVLHGVSLASVEASIRYAVLTEMERPIPMHWATRPPVERVTDAAQHAVNDLIRRGLIVATF